MKPEERFEILRDGWNRRSAVMMDYVGCPVWMVKRRCPTSKGWGTLLYILASFFDPSIDLDDNNPPEE